MPAFVTAVAKLLFYPYETNPFAELRKENDLAILQDKGWLISMKSKILFNFAPFYSDKVKTLRYELHSNRD